MTVKILFSDGGNTPPGKLADAELHFGESQHHQHEHERPKSEREQAAIGTEPRQAAKRHRPQDRQ